jgi:hypothetical protein
VRFRPPTPSSRRACSARWDVGDAYDNALAASFSPRSDGVLHRQSWAIGAALAQTMLDTWRRSTTRSSALLPRLLAQRLRTPPQRLAVVSAADNRRYRSPRSETRALHGPTTWTMGGSRLLPKPGADGPMLLPAAFSIFSRRDAPSPRLPNGATRCRPPPTEPEIGWSGDSESSPRF